MDNALRHNMPGGRLDVSTRTQNSRAVLSVANTGPAVPATAEDRLFQPFQRLGAERVSHTHGNGLGLAIVRAIADVHGAALTANARSEGGLDIHVSFPASPASPAAAEHQPSAKQ
jgi:signal transduction histidine kinase